MVDESEGGNLDLAEVEAELCRLPDVAAVRIVADAIGRPVEVHVLAHTGKQPKQVVRDVQSFAMLKLGLDIDRCDHQIRGLEESIEALKLERARLLDPARVEQIAREKLGLVEPADADISYRGKNSPSKERP